jgi:predicted kinase
MTIDKTPELEILVGMIASGKSTYCKMRAREGAVIINDDSITMALHANQYGLYNKKYKMLYKAIEMDIITQALGMGIDIVVDRPNLSKETRARYISLARALEVQAVGVVFEMFKPEVHAKRRTIADARGNDYKTWLEIANFHLSKFQEPTLDEFDQLRYVKWDPR